MADNNAPKPSKKSNGGAARKGPRLPKAQAAQLDKALGAPTPRPSKEEIGRVTATNLKSRLLGSVPKLDKHGTRLLKSIQQIVDGGDQTNLDALRSQVDGFIANGAPEETKSSRRRTEAATLTDADKAAIDNEVAARGGLIASVQNERSGMPSVILTSAGGEHFVCYRDCVTAEFTEMAVVGKPYAAAVKVGKALMEARKDRVPGKLAHGVDGHNSPNAARAVASNGKTKTPMADKAKAQKVAEAAKKAERKEKAAATAAPKADDNRKITVTDKAFTYGKPGTSRNASWIACTKAKTVADYAKAGGALKYLPRWVGANAIKLG